MTVKFPFYVRIALLAASGVLLTAAAEFPLAPLAAAVPLTTVPATDADAGSLPQVAVSADMETSDRPTNLQTLVAHTDVDAPIYGDRECLARAVYFEARGEPLAGQLAVAQVILNRVASGRYAGTVCGVINQPGQFSFHSNRAPADNRDWRVAKAIAAIAATGGWDVIAPRATAFHATRVAVNWTSMHKVGTIGNHVFYR